MGHICAWLHSPVAAVNVTPDPTQQCARASSVAARLSGHLFGHDNPSLCCLRTLDKSRPTSGGAGIYALDCDRSMCTVAVWTAGMQLYGHRINCHLSTVGWFRNLVPTPPPPPPKHHLERHIRLTAVARRRPRSDGPSARGPHALEAPLRMASLMVGVSGCQRVGCPCR
jgi:hypothetical protein